MSKTIIRVLAIIGLGLAAFIVAALALPFSKNGVFWLGFVFGIIALLMQIYTLHSAFSGKTVKSRFYGIPIARIGLIYLVIQMFASFGEFAKSDILPVWAALITNFVLFAIAAIGCISTEIVRDEVERQDRELKKKVSNIRELQSISQEIANSCSNVEIKKELQKVVDEIKYSDPMSADVTVALENDIWQKLQDLKTLVSENNLNGTKEKCKSILSSLSERNRLCKANK